LRRFAKQQRAKLPSFRILFEGTSQECDRICVRKDYPSFRNPSFAGNQEPLSAIALFPDVKHLCIRDDNNCKQLLPAVEVPQRAESKCFCKRRLRIKNLSRSDLFNKNCSSAGRRASIRDCANLPVFQINVPSELLLIEPSKAHVLRDVHWLEPLVTPLSDDSSLLS
jgi:hypothetical protein